MEGFRPVKLSVNIVGQEPSATLVPESGVFSIEGFNMSFRVSLEKKAQHITPTITNAANAHIVTVFSTWKLYLMLRVATKKPQQIFQQQLPLRQAYCYSFALRCELHC